MSRIVRGWKPAPGVVTLTPESNLERFLLDSLENDDMADMIRRSSTIGKGEKKALLLQLSESQMESREGRLYQTNSIGTMVLIRGNDYGTRSFWISLTPITQAQYKSVTGMNPSEHQGDNLPVENVTWLEGTQFCNRLSRREKRPEVYFDEGTQLPGGRISDEGYRYLLPSEWRWAARGDTTLPFSGSQYVGEVGWYNENSGRQSQPVGMKKPNQFGVFDMTGNVQEWTAIWFEDDSGSPMVESAGGSFLMHPYECSILDSAQAAKPNKKFKDIGLRICLPYS